jgi:hypothetical protein
MRVGFIKQLLWERYGQVWTDLVQSIDVEVRFADVANVQRHLATLQTPTQQPTLPGVSFRLAVAEAFALLESDILIAPDLNPDDLHPDQRVARGGGQDPWIASFPEALQRMGGLPPILKVPASLEGNLETLALETLLSLNHDPTKARLAWERNQQRLKPKRYPEPRWTKLPGQKTVTAILGQPWLLTANLLALVSTSERHVISQNQLSPSLLRDEAKRLEKRLIATDAETLGAAHYFNRKGSVDNLLMIVDSSSGADLWLEAQVKKIVAKPLEIVNLRDLISESTAVETLLVAG